MVERAQALWPVAALGVTGVVSSLGGAPPSAAAAVALTAGALTFAGTRAVAAAWRRRCADFAAAARGLQPGAPPAGETEDPSALAREVVTAAQQAQETTRQLAVLRAVIDGMNEGVWITSEDGAVIEHNNALKELLFAGQELVGQRPGLLLGSPELEQAVLRACREGTSTRLELPVEGLRPRVLSANVSPLGRELGGSAAVFFDVTELRRLEKVRKDFVANVSHELRTPITAIRGYAETLQSGAINDPATAAKMVDIIHRQSERLSELVEDLLELSRLESKQLQLAAKPVDLGEAAQRALEAVRPKARPRGTSIEVLVPAGVQVQGDQRAVEQIVLNLVDNAVKYSPNGGRVQVSASPSGDFVEMRVKDDGPGIEARHLTRIFERFYRVDKGRSREMGGTGLGLSIVKHLATAMGGDVRCESAPGQGSTFFVLLPVPGAAVTPTAETSGPTELPPTP